jgi:hypothetical protein
MIYYVQIRRGGFIDPAPWGDKGTPFYSLDWALDFVRGIQELAVSYNVVIDYIITDEKGTEVKRG